MNLVSYLLNKLQNSLKKFILCTILDYKTSWFIWKVFSSLGKFNKTTIKKLSWRKTMSKKPFPVFSSLDFFLKLSALHKERIRIHSATIPNVILMLNILLPNTYCYSCGIWLYIELNFDTKLVAQSFALTVSGLLGVIGYICLISNKRLFLRAVDHFKNTVVRSMVN